MFHGIDKGYTNKIAGFLTKIFTPRVIEASCDDDIDYAEQILIEQATEHFNDETMAKHTVAIINNINDGSHALSPQHVFLEYAIANELPSGQQKMISAYLRDRNLDIWSEDDVQQRDQDILVLAQQINSDFGLASSLNGYNFYSAPGPYAVVENQHTNASWIINANSMPNNSYMGKAYPSREEAFDAVRNIAKRDSITYASVQEAIVPSIHVAGNMAMIDINDKSFVIDTTTDPPRFIESEQSPYDTNPAIKAAVKTAAKVDGYDAGVTRIKVIYHGEVAMGTILGARTHHAPSGDINEYRISLDKPHSKIVWVRDCDVINVYNNQKVKKASSPEVFRYAKSKYRIDDRLFNSRIQAAQYITQQYGIDQNSVTSILINTPIVAQADDEFTAEDARKAGEFIGINWDEVEFTPESLAKGMNEEAKEHDRGHDEPIDLDVINNRLIDSAKIAVSHLMEDPMYYDKENDNGVYAQLTSNPAPLPGTKPVEKPGSMPNNKPSPNPVQPSPEPSQTPDGLGDKPELPPETKTDDSNRADKLTADIGSLSDQIKNTAKSMFQIDLDDDSKQAVIKQVINTLANEIAKQTAESVLKSYSPDKGAGPKDVNPPTSKAHGPAPVSAPKPTMPPAGI